MSRTIPSDVEFEVSPPPARALWVLPVIWVALVGTVFALGHQTLLQPDPSSPVPAWLVMMSAIALGLVAPLVLLRYRRIRIRERQLWIQAAGVFTHKVTLETLDLERARIVDLDEHTDLKPTVRLLGMGLPGFRAGHYLLRNRARAFCLLTRQERVLVLPRHDGRYLLLSAEQPRELLESLRKAAGTPRG